GLSDRREFRKSFVRHEDIGGQLILVSGERVNRGNCICPSLLHHSCLAAKRNGYRAVFAILRSDQFASEGERRNLIVGTVIPLALRIAWAEAIIVVPAADAHEVGSIFLPSGLALALPRVRYPFHGY